MGDVSENHKPHKPLFLTRVNKKVRFTEDVERESLRRKAQIDSNVLELSITPEDDKSDSLPKLIDTTPQMNAQVHEQPGPKRDKHGRLDLQLNCPEEPNQSLPKIEEEHPERPLFEPKDAP